MKTLDDIFDILLDGSKRQISALSGTGIQYSYSPKYGGFDLRGDTEEIRACKVYDPPNCVKYFGNEHTF